MKRILCLIDALGPGGAERQMTGLASMLSNAGNDVEVWYHEPKHFFAEQLRDAGVKVRHYSEAANAKKRVKVYRDAIKKYKPEVVIAYLQGSCITSCLVRLSGIKFKLIVSERNTNQSKTFKDYLRFNLFRIADYVVPNSYSQQNFINKHFGFLKSKTKVITNFVDTDRFCPVDKHTRSNLVIVAATIWPSKNTMGFIRALALLKDTTCDFKIKWFGKVADQSEYFDKCESLIRELNLENNIELLDKTSNIIFEYQKADFLCLPSFYEGTPNVICEAMSCGLPILCSDVCDNARYVSNNMNGFLFNPKDTVSIAKSLEDALMMDDMQYVEMRDMSCSIALNRFSTEVFLDKYLKLL